jgi:hypothetical protein
MPPSCESAAGSRRSGRVPLGAFVLRSVIGVRKLPGCLTGLNGPVLSVCPRLEELSSLVDA